MTLRFLAEPIYVNFGGKVHGGAVMKWIEQYAVRLQDFRKQLDQEMEARLKWPDEQRPDHLSRVHA
jgi:hypothetical protein